MMEQPEEYLLQNRESKQKEQIKEQEGKKTNQINFQQDIPNS